MKKTVIDSRTMEVSTQEGTLETPVIDGLSTQGATHNYSTILGMIGVAHTAVMLEDGSDNNTRDTGSLDLESTLTVLELGSQQRMHNVQPMLKLQHSVRQEIQHSKPVKPHNRSRQSQRCSRIRRQARPRSRKVHREKVISRFVSVAANLAMAS
jgi:hypothetical protein